MNSDPVCLCTGYILTGELAPNPEEDGGVRTIQEVRLEERAHKLRVPVQFKYRMLERTSLCG